MKYLTVLLLFLVLSAQASNLSISNPMVYQEGDESYTTFNLRWENSWHNDRNHDAVWLFFKAYSNEKLYHIPVAMNGHEVVSNFSKDEASFSFETPEDRTGLFFMPNTAYRGTVEVTLKIKLDSEGLKDLRTIGREFTAYGIEMVYIPEGGFVLGDPNSEANKFGGFHDPDGNGTVKVSQEDQEFKIGPDGDLFYHAGSEGYEGDQTGVVPAAFPKGVAAFYIMKYEPTEGQYATFLNSLLREQVSARLIFEHARFYYHGGTLVRGEDRFITSYPDMPCSFLGWADAMAFADWAGLRPMTEFEFVKAARGTVKPEPHDYPWGNDGKEKIQRLPDSNGVLTMVNEWDESMLDDATKVYFGASYYWVMDLAGSKWERVISIGHPKGRAFIGQHGDGVLTADGEANVSDWPSGIEAEGGVGFRGGGFYGYERSYHQYNPYSPVSFRPYGGWSGGMREFAYGSRLVRTATRK